MVSPADRLSDAQHELQCTKSELLEVRQRLVMAQQETPKVVRELLEKFNDRDVDAHRVATEVRYTAMALEAAADRLEVELRRLLEIGLTPDAVDVAAVEAGARAVIRQHIGYRAAPVSAEPPVAISLGDSVMNTAQLPTRLTQTPPVHR